MSIEFYNNLRGSSMSQHDSKNVGPRHRLLCCYFVKEYEPRGVGVKNKTKHRNEAWKEGELTGGFLTNMASTRYQKQPIFDQERTSSERPHGHSLGQLTQGTEKGRRYPLVPFPHW